MPGLDHIPRYQTGGDVDQTDTTATPIMGKAVPSKGKYGLPTPTGATGVDEGILQRMQQMIAEREAQKNSFSEAMRDAQAWWSGGAAGPFQALTQRAKEREEQEATTFGMRRDLAQYRVAQDQAKNFDKALFGAPQPISTAQPQTGTAPVTTPGTAPTTTAPAQAQQSGGLLDLVVDPGLRQSITVQARSGDRAGALKAVQSYLAENAKNPDIIKKVNYMLSRNMIDPKLVPQIILTEAIGPSALKPEDVRGVVGGVPGTYQTTPFEKAGTLVKPAAAPAAAMPAPAAPTAAPAAPTTAPTAAPAAPTTAPTAAPAATPTGPAAGPQPLPQVQPLPKIGQTPEAPVAPAGQTPKPVAAAPVSKESLAVSQATEIKRGEKRAEASEEERKDFKASTASSDVTDRKIISDRIATLVKDNPKIAGVISDPTFFNGLAQLVKSGVSTPKGPIGLHDIEEFIFNSLPSTDFPDKVERRELASYLARFELMNSQLVKGQGQVSNAERQIIRDASVSISDPAEVIYKRAKMVARRAELDSQLSDIYGAKEYTNFEDFKRDPAYKAAFKQYENDLRNIVSEKVVLSKANIKANAVKQRKAASTAVPQDVQDILKKYPGKP